MIRKAQQKDIPRITELLLQVEMVHHAIRPDIFKWRVSKYSSEELLHIFADESTPVFVAVDEKDRVAGYAFCRITEYKNHPLLVNRKTVYIDDLCVDETQRGTGIGSALYDYVKTYAKEIGAHSVTLNVWEGNEKAKDFYRKKGLKVQRYYLEENL